MSKSIKISEDAYEGLHRLQRPRESLSEVVERLLTVSLLMEKVQPYLETERVSLERKLESIDASKPDNP